MCVVSLPVRIIRTVGIPQDCSPKDVELQVVAADRRAQAQLDDVHVCLLLLNVLISAPPAGFLLENKSQWLPALVALVRRRLRNVRRVLRSHSPHLPSRSSFTLFTPAVEALRRSTETRYFRIGCTCPWPVSPDSWWQLFSGRAAAPCLFKGREPAMKKVFAVGLQLNTPAADEAGGTLAK